MLKIKKILNNFKVLETKQRELGIKDKQKFN